MAFLAPLALFLGLLSLPIIIMYMLRLRRPEVVVSSTFLWQKLLRDREANAPWQKLRRNLLLLLQLLILALLVLALARPYLPLPSLVNQSVVVLLDASASMQATDVEPNRFTAAQQEVEQLIGDLSGSNRMTLIEVGATPTILAAATTDKNALRQALASAQPSNGAVDWPAAFALASGAAQGFQDARVIVVSDGGLPDRLPPLPGETVYIPIGTSSENLALTALATRATDAGPELFASITNHGLLPQETLFSLGLDGALFDAKQVSVPAGETINLSWQLPDQAAILEATLSNNEDDYLAVDNQAFAVHEAGIQNRALLVTEGNIFLEQVYGVLPGIEAFKAEPEAVDYSSDPPYDLYIFDGVAVPDPPPAADILVINPVDSPLTPVTGIVTNTQQTAAIRLADDPLMQFVDWSGVNIATMKQVDMPWARPLVEAEGGPLVLVGEQDGHRRAIMTFDLQASDLPLQITFPILMANLTAWLNPGQAFDAPDNAQPGDLITLVPSASATQVTITRPDGTVWQAAIEGDELIYTATEQPGLYQVALVDETGEQPAGSFAINLFDGAESLIQPRDSVQLGTAEITPDTTADIGQQEIWGWLAVFAFIVLLLEWWIYHRGTRRPKLPTAADVAAWRTRFWPRQR